MDQSERRPQSRTVLCQPPRRRRETDGKAGRSDQTRSGHRNHARHSEERVRDEESSAPKSHEERQSYRSHGMVQEVGR